MRRSLPLAVALLLGVAAPAWAFNAVAPVQEGTITNSETASAVSGAAVKTITGVPFKSVHLYMLSGRCDTTFANLAITVGGVTVWSEVSFVSVNGQTAIRSFTPVPLTGTVGSTMVITLGPCAPNSTATLDVVADIF